MPIYKTNSSEWGIFLVKSEKLAEQILKMIETLNQAACQLHEIIANEKADCNEFIQLMIEMLSKMVSPLQHLSSEEPALMAQLMCKNVASSLINIMALKETDSKKACKKIEFELLPLINELYVDLYFWGFCYPDKKKMRDYYHNDMFQLCPLPYVENAEKNEAYPYEVSIVVIAYNKLDYTKKCLEYLKKYFPDHISHELILVNNGSNDGTKEYFESIHPDKQIDIRYNTKCFAAVSRIIEGRYILFISNDILITPHAVENMLACIRSDESIGCVVPSCPNIANLQTIPSKYSNLEELIVFAERNNKSDPCRWEQRTRLNSPVLLARSNTKGVYAFFGYLYPFFPERFLAFTDDLMSLLLRRNGLKCILAKDAYVHHFGSITIREEAKQRLYIDGRREFERTFGIDPWGTGFCFDPTLMDILSPENSDPINVLGVNCGIGGNPLKIKEILLEKKRNHQVQVYNISDKVQYRKDLEGVSDLFQPIENWSKIENTFPGTIFSYVIVEDMDQRKDAIKIISKLFARLSIGGKMAVKSDNIAFQNSMKGIYKKNQAIKSWVIVQKDC